MDQWLDLERMEADGLIEDTVPAPSLEVMALLVEAAGHSTAKMSLEEIVAAYNAAQETFAAAAALEGPADAPVDPAPVDNTPLVQETANTDHNFEFGIDQLDFDAVMEQLNFELELGINQFNATAPLVQDTANTNIDTGLGIGQVPALNTPAPVAQPQSQGAVPSSWGNPITPPLTLPSSQSANAHWHHWYSPPNVTPAYINDNTIASVVASERTEAEPTDIAPECLWDPDTTDRGKTQPQPTEAGWNRWAWLQRHGLLMVQPNDRDHGHCFSDGYHMSRDFLLVHHLKVENMVKRRVPTGEINPKTGKPKSTQALVRGGGWSSRDRPATSMEYCAWRREMVFRMAGRLRSQDHDLIVQGRADMERLMNWGVLPRSNTQNFLEVHELADVEARLMAIGI